MYKLNGDKWTQLSTEKIDSYQKTKHITWSEICHNDFEIDLIISPHEPSRN